MHRLIWINKDSENTKSQSGALISRHRCRTAISDVCLWISTVNNFCTTSGYDLTTRSLISSSVDYLSLFVSLLKPEPHIVFSFTTDEQRYSSKWINTFTSRKSPTFWQLLHPKKIFLCIFFSRPTHDMFLGNMFFFFSGMFLIWLLVSGGISHKRLHTAGVTALSWSVQRRQASAGWYRTLCTVLLALVWHEYIQRSSAPRHSGRNGYRRVCSSRGRRSVGVGRGGGGRGWNVSGDASTAPHAAFLND